MTIPITWCIKVQPRNPYWDLTCSFFNSSNCGLVIEMAHVACARCFFRHSWVTWFDSPQYKQQTKVVCTSTFLLLLCEGLESYLINMHGVILWWGCRRLGWHCRRKTPLCCMWCKTYLYYQCWFMTPFLSMFKKSIVTPNNLCNDLT